MIDADYVPGPGKYNIPGTFGFTERIISDSIRKRR
jgi:hypothetical protein